MIHDHRPPIGCADLGIGQVLLIISDGQRHLIRHQPLIQQIHGQHIRHLPDHQPGLGMIVGLMEHLPRRNGIGRRAVSPDVPDRAGLVAPGMIDQELRIDPEEPIQQIFIMELPRLPQRASGHIPHGVHPIAFQLSRIPRPHTPKIRKRPVPPQKPPITQLVQLRDPHSILVRWDLLGHDVHSDFTKVKIGADPGGGRDPGLRQHLPDQLPGQLMGCHMIGLEIGRGIDEHLIDGIDMDILRCDIPQIHLIDPGTALDIMPHPGLGDDEPQFQRRILLQLRGITGLPPEGLPRRLLPSGGVDLPDTLYRLKKPCPTGNSAGLQRRRYRQTDRLLRPALVRHHQMGGQRIHAPFDALLRGIERFQIDRDILPLPLHAPTS